MSYTQSLLKHRFLTIRARAGCYLYIIMYFNVLGKKSRRYACILILLPVLRSVIDVPVRNFCWLPSAFIRV